MVSSSEDDGGFWGGRSFCWACRALGGLTAAAVVVETEDVVTLINPFPLADGHCLIVPRAHIENIYALPDVLAGPLLSMAARVSRAVKTAFGADGITLRQNNEPASDQHLFHFHLHVVPRFTGDSVRFATEPQHISLERQTKAAARIAGPLA